MTRFNEPDTPLTYDEAAAFRSALIRFARSTDKKCRQNGLTSQQYTLLLMIKGAANGREVSTVTELSRRLSLSHNGMVERVQRAVQAGLIRRDRSSSDARVTELRLTPEGAARLRRTFLALGAEIQLLLGVVHSVGQGREPSIAEVSHQ